MCQIASSVTATFSEQVQASTIGFTLQNGSTTLPGLVSYNPATQTVTLTPSASLDYATTYTATLSGAQDLYGNTMSPVSWTFTTISAPSPSGPTVAMQSPGSNAAGVAITSNLTAAFDGDVQPSTISFTLLNGTTPVPATVTFDPVSLTVTLDPAANLAPSTTYTATLSSAQDLAGNTMSPVSWTFTTEATVTTAPTLITQSPPNGTSGVAVASSVSATFSVPVQPGTISFTLMNGATPVAAAVNYNPFTQTVAIFPTANLAYATTYTATLSGAQDLYGNTMSLVSWSFTTEAAIVTSPAAVVTESPASSATSVAVAGNLRATFNEPVQASTISFTLMNGAIPVPATVTYDPASDTVTLDPTASLAHSTTYTATLSGAQDLAGETMATVSWSFSTTPMFDSSAPTVTSVGPLRARRACQSPAQ